MKKKTHTNSIRQDKILTKYMKIDICLKTVFEEVGRDV